MTPNTVIVLLDDVGVDQISAYGYPGAPPTPTFDALADQGVRFDQAWATPVCSPTRAALITGEFADRNEVGAVIMAKQDKEMPLSVRTLPELLRRADQRWASAAIGKWHMATLASASGAEHALLQGFDWFAGSMNNIGVPPVDEPDVPRSYVAWDRVGFDGQVHLETTFSTTAITTDAIAALTVMPEPFVLYVAYHAAHRPLMVPPGALPEGAEVDENELFALNVAAADAEIARLLDALGDRRANTLVMVIGDNGTPSYAKDEDGQGGAKGSFREGGLRVPFVVAGPGVAHGVSDALVSVVDVVPTVLVAAGVDPAPLHLDGLPMQPALQDPAAATVHEVLYSETRHPPTGPPWRHVERAARDRDLKLVDDDGEQRLFRLDGFQEAPVARKALTAEEQARVEALEAELARHPR
ncbi:MAG: sulfatase-like hydrolase/transferase [Myxococcota bacterium]